MTKRLSFAAPAMQHENTAHAKPFTITKTNQQQRKKNKTIIMTHSLAAADTQIIPSSIFHAVQPKM